MGTWQVPLPKVSMLRGSAPGINPTVRDRRYKEELRTRGDAGAQHADPLDLQLDHVTRFQPAAGMFRRQLEDATSANGSAPDQISRKQVGIARSVSDHPGKRMEQTVAVAV